MKISFTGWSGGLGLSACVCGAGNGSAAIRGSVTSTITLVAKIIFGLTAPSPVKVCDNQKTNYFHYTNLAAKNKLAP